MVGGPRRRLAAASKLRDDEVFLADVAFRAPPVGRDVFETGAGRNTLVRQAVLFVIDPAANQADPCFKFHYFSHVSTRLRCYTNSGKAGILPVRRD